MSEPSGTGMGRQIRRTSVVVIAMFAALLVAISIIQVGSADDLRDDPRNRRTQLANQNVNRGPILVAGVPIAYSVPTDEEIAYQRVYANGPLYAPITGRYTLQGENTGLEAAYDDYLTASTGGQFFDQISAVFTGQKPQGAAVETTIDPEIQQAAWDALGDYQGAIVVLEPSTGRVLAMVSKPSYDPNALASHDTAAVDQTFDQLDQDPGKPLINRAMNGDLDPPGSTFKLVVASAALQSGKYSPDSAFPNPASLQLPQSSATIANSNGGTCGGIGSATVTMSQAVIYSCNIPMAELAGELTYVPIKDEAKAYGFCTGFDVARVLEPIEYGCTPQDSLDLTPMYSTPSNYPAVLDAPQTMLSGFGQSSVRASPLQMAMVSAAIANQGVLMEPSLVDSVIAPDQSTLVEIEPKTYGQPISAATAQALTAMMVGNVDGGTGTAAQIEGVSVAGKTGTAENGVDESGAALPYTLWFTGFAPAEAPRAAVAVVVQNGAGLGTEGTSAIAAAIGGQVLRAVISQ